MLSSTMAMSLSTRAKERLGHNPFRLGSETIFQFYCTIASRFNSPHIRDVNGILVTIRTLGTPQEI